MGNKLTYPEDVDLSEKVAIVTGGNTGIGYETAKGLARLGAHTFIACRNKERAEAAIDKMKNELGVVTATPKATGAEGGGAGEDVKSKEGKKVGEIEYLPLDLSSFQSTKDFVRLFKEKNLPLHILVNNAAICGVPYDKTADGFESQFQVNHLSHMLLTLELLPLLQDTAAQSGDVRIVIVASYVHQMAPPFDPTRLNRTENEYTRTSGYSNSKLYNIMMGYALRRRLPDNNITISSLHPGYVDTELSRGIKDMTVFSFLAKVSVKAVGRSPVNGAATSLNCAVNPDLKSERHLYYDSCKPTSCTADARNKEFQEELWRRSIEFLKDHLSPEILEKYGRKPDSQAAKQNGTGGGTANCYPVTASSKEEGATGNNAGSGAVKSPDTGVQGVNHDAGGVAPKDLTSSHEPATQEDTVKDGSPSANATGAGEIAGSATKQDDGSKKDSKPETENGGGAVEVVVDVHEEGVATDTASPENKEEEEDKVECEAGSQ